MDIVLDNALLHVHRRCLSSIGSDYLEYAEL